MAPNTDTLTAPPSTTAPEAPRPPEARGGPVTWVAVIASCIAVVAIAVAAVVISNDESGTTTTQLDPQAEQQERQAHLDGQANTHGAGSGAVTPNEAASQYARFHAAERGYAVTPSEAASQYARFHAAERYERQAHLDGQAVTHGQRSAEVPAATDEADTPDPEFLPGSRHVPTR